MVAVARAAAIFRLRAGAAPGCDALISWKKPGSQMDAIVEIIRAILAVGTIVLVLLLIPVLFMTIFSIATGIDERLNR
jgi:hypothetical protein